MALVGPIRIRVQSKPRIRCRVLPRLIPLNASIEIGTVTTGAPGSEATVVNSGTSLDAVLDFSIPQGAQGNPGVVQSIVPGALVTVDSSDPAHPVVDASGAQPLDAELTSWAGVTRASGFDTFAAAPSSANLKALLTDETGTGAAVFATSPTLIAPALGTPSALVLTNATGLPIAGGGTGAASADSARLNLATPVYVATRTAMKALTTTKDLVAILQEAGREGTFVVKTGSPPVTDTQEGIYVVSNTAGFYWERIYAPALAPTVRAFGAALDGVTVDSNAIKGALAVCGMAIIPYTSTGFVAGDIDITPNLDHVIKSERRPIWKIPSGAACAIRVLPSAVAQSYAYIDKFTFDGSAAANTSGAILINTSAGIVSGLRVGNSVVKDCGFFYKEEVHASNYVVDMKFDDVLCFFTRGRQIDSRRSRGFFFWNNIKVDNTYNFPGGRPLVTWISVFFSDPLGLDFNAIDVVGEVPGAPNNLAYQAGATGIYIDGVVGGRGSIYGRRLLVDSATGPGIRIANVFNVEIDTIQSYANLGSAIELNAVSKSSFNKVKAVGSKGVTNAAAAATGVSMIGCTFVSIGEIEADNNTGSGNAMTGCGDCGILGGYSINNGAYGFFEDNTGSRNRRVGVTSTGNTTASLFQNMASSATYSWTPNSGTPTASTIGVATV